MNWDRIESVRWWARSLLTIAGIAITIVVFRLIVAPVASPMFGGTEPKVLEFPVSWLMTAIGIGGVLFGLAWMWRIYRAPTKSDGAVWRYRDH